MKAIINRIRAWGLAGVRSFALVQYRNAVQRRRLAAAVRNSRAGEPERGVTVIGEMTGQVSLSKTLRDFVLCLKDAGIPCQTYDTLLKPQIPDADSKDVVTPPGEFDIGRYSHIVMMFRAPLDKNLLPGLPRARIAFHDSEHGIHDTMPFLRESGDAIVAMSDFNFNYFKRAFPDQPVHKIPYPFRFKRKDATPRNEIRARYGVGTDDFLVFFNFDFGSYYRKNIPAALKAFALAFSGDGSAKLLFKTKGAAQNRRRAAEMERMAAELGIARQLIHVSQYLPRSDVDGLTGACDAYLSLHKSEGFGLGIAEALSQGKPVVATDWSANTEFCRAGTAWCIPYRMAPIMPHEYLVSMKEWAEADPVAAAAALREIRGNPELVAERTAAGRRFMEEHFSISNFKKSVDAFLDGRTSWN